MLLLAACASEAPQEPAAPPPAAEQTVDIDTEAPLPADFHALTGRLDGAPAGSDIELALLQIDDNHRPQKMLATMKLKGTGTPIAFKLPFNPEKFPANGRVELHGRVTQAGMLIKRLPQRYVSGSNNQSLGTLMLVPAP
ncbi:hypothetical protein GCM10009304_26030 [Pseudomonas matsuisoli]|uniref:Lipoprotein n=2 Tax=Pseudomonas matsuisoli TaxID=1515666 RepID=A0A917PXN4_9PSED|nr:hypothetical protein GCM10009304_26030 [Pseudomonas matsuisoli]